ncbi:hypothetical protein Tco_0595008 [Tanacetum coccineum]
MLSNARRSMERFENAIFKQREEINGRMTEMSGLLKELTTSKAPEKVLIREEAPNPVQKALYFISLSIREEEEKKDIYGRRTDDVVEKLTGTDYGGVQHRINEKLIEGLVGNNRFNDSLSRARVGKKKGKTYNVLPRGPVYEAILNEKFYKEGRDMEAKL